MESIIDPICTLLYWLDQDLVNNLDKTITNVNILLENLEGKFNLEKAIADVKTVLESSRKISDITKLTPISYDSENQINNDKLSVEFLTTVLRANLKEKAKKKLT